MTLVLLCDTEAPVHSSLLVRQLHLHAAEQCDRRSIHLLGSHWSHINILHPTVHLSSSSFLFFSFTQKTKQKRVLRINQEVLNCHAGGVNCGSDAKRCACDPFKASCSGIKLTLAVRALTQREMRTDERVELQRPAQGHFKRTHVFCRSLWLSWRSNQRPFSFKKGYFTMRPACGEVVNYHAGEGNPGLYSDDCT